MKQLNPKAIYLFFFNSLLRSLTLLLPIIIYLFVFFIPLRRSLQQKSGLSNVYESSFWFLDWLWLIIPLYIILCFIWAELSYRFYCYELLENGFRKESGVIYKRYVTIPYDRIQNVNIDRGILARILGLSDLSIETAGFSAVQLRRGYSAEGRLPGLSVEIAEQLRDELIERARKSKSQGL